MDIQELLPPMMTPAVAPQLHRFSIEQYHRMGEAQIFAHNDHVELIYGLILDKHTNGVPHRFSVEQYHRMIETGILSENDKVELIEGLILGMSPIGSPHSYAVDELYQAIQEILPHGWKVFAQRPVSLATAEPEPDLSVVRGDGADFKARHPGPADIGLLVEVADSSLEFDRQVKLRMYAAAGVPEYWIVNLRDRRIELHRDPITDAPAGAAYSFGEIIPATGKIPLILDSRPCAEIVVAAILP
jgi:Uma2 family endonuclease